MPPRKTENSTESDNERTINLTLDALTRLMDLYRAERWIYLLGAMAGLGLALWSIVMLIRSNALDMTQLGLLFGSSGILAVTGARVAYFLNRSFSLVEIVIKKLAGVS